MKRRDPDPVSRRRIERRRVRDCVNRCNEEQQANETDGPFMFQIVLNVAENIPFRASTTRIKNILALYKGSCSTLVAVNV